MHWALGALSHRWSAAVFVLPTLPYAYDALEPTISAEALRLHHDKHHAKYVETVNDLCGKESLRPASLEDLVVEARTAGRTKLHNNAAQAWNHAFFWPCMTPDPRPPEGELAGLIAQGFGSLDQLRSQFVDAGQNHFGSGWAWLLATPGGLKINSTHDGEDHLGEAGVVPLITCDLWEHAYYLDYKNDRKAYLEAWFDKLADWTFAAHQLAAANGAGEAWRYPAPDDQPARRQA